MWLWMSCLSPSEISSAKDLSISSRKFLLHSKRITSFPQMRISVLQDRDRFWTSRSLGGHPKPEQFPEGTGLLETSAVKPRDTAVTESVVDRPDVLHLRFEPRLRMGKEPKRVIAAFHRDPVARKLSVPLFGFSAGNLLPDCARL